jgi:hypothetical protein
MPAGYEARCHRVDDISLSANGTRVWQVSVCGHEINILLLSDFIAGIVVHLLNHGLKIVGQGAISNLHTRRDATPLNPGESVIKSLISEYEQSLCGTYHAEE